MMKLEKRPFSPNKKNKILYGRAKMMNKLLLNTSTQTHSMSKDECTQVTKNRLGKNVDSDANKFPILENSELIKKLQAISMTNNQKGRIRQLLRDSFVGTPEHKMPEVINRKIEWIINNSHNPELLTDAEMRKIKILYNMLKTWLKKLELKTDKNAIGKVKTKKSSKKTGKTVEGMAGDHVNWSEAISKRVEAVKDKQKQEDDIKREKAHKPKNKRYVVFIGNLPKSVDKLQIMQHFGEFSDHIKSVRIPKSKEGDTHNFAYAEFDDEPSFEYALSRNHTMMANRRINVEYTTLKTSKISKSEAKGKAAKLSALQRSGVLVGSIPLSRKRSARRKKMRDAKNKRSDSSFETKS